ncbi:ubiquinol-cytochrome C chaperone family protein [Asticcacaulis endophyticus]|jgi:cytochrome b pre-mRNA-processing protein 3|uniref:Ubiquinol-cytochrome c chaperone n=1 Tax=Asticcacaulis endophyticus TaxID=1395890 RepID=A0A918UXJ1_9CAUL|nr:ubiquinol-cytochrome C chaperone family protein [Asticcacaulis endophyticus]GGZ41011.1 ubiquinol-cytochrome c chaperone [Asticcacaulis endophyticus]
MLQKLLAVFANFKPRPAVVVGQILYGQCVSQSRQVPFYVEYGVKDEISARFELLCLHVILALQTLKLPVSDPHHEQAKETAQALFDSLLRGLDDTMREQGVGDLSVAKKMKALGKVVYARIKGWDDLLESGASLEHMTDYILRTVYADDEAVAGTAPAAKAEDLAEYVDRARKTLSLSDLLHGKSVWPALS